MSQERVAAAEAALVQAALDAGDLGRAEVDRALAATRARRARGEPLTLPQALAPQLRPEQRERLAAIYRAALAGPADPNATVLPGTAAQALAPAPQPRASAPAPALLPTALPAPGERVGDVEVVRELARGGQGAVFLGKDGAGRQVALKVLLGSGDGLRRQRFDIEARATAALRHPGIVQVHAFGEDARGRAYLVMDFIDGESLADRIERAGPLPPPEALALARGMAEALAAAHAAGVIHRDLKPANVLLPRDGGARLTDFGLARIEDQRERLTRTGQMLGTPAFMPPEQINGRSALMGPASDVYSFGATLYMMLTGEPPFDTSRPLISLLAAILEGKVAPPSARRPEVGPDLDALVLRCLAREPEERFADGAALLRALDDPARVRAEAARGARRGALGRALAVAAGAALTLGVAAGVILALRSPPEPTPPSATTPPPPAPPPAPPPSFTATFSTPVALGPDGRWRCAVALGPASFLRLRLEAPAGAWSLEARRAGEDDPAAPAPWRAGGETALERGLLIAPDAVPTLAPGATLDVVVLGPAGRPARAEAQAAGVLRGQLGAPGERPPESGLTHDPPLLDPAALAGPEEAAALREAVAGILTQAERVPSFALGAPRSGAKADTEATLATLTRRVGNGTPQARVYTLGVRDRIPWLGWPPELVAETGRLLEALPREPAALWLHAQARRPWPADAARSLRALLALAPDSRPARLALANALRSGGEPGEALAHARLVLALEPHEPDANRLVALLEAVTPTPATTAALVDRLLLTARTAALPARRLTALQDLDGWLEAHAADAPAREAAARTLAALGDAPEDELAQTWELGPIGGAMGLGTLRVHAIALTRGRAAALAEVERFAAVVERLDPQAPGRAQRQRDVEQLRAWAERRP